MHSWRGAWLNTGTTLPFALTFRKYEYVVRWDVDGTGSGSCPAACKLHVTTCLTSSPGIDVVKTHYGGEGTAAASKTSLVLTN
jgi:hypothetical protein